MVRRIRDAAAMCGGLLCVVGVLTVEADGTASVPDPHPQPVAREAVKEQPYVGLVLAPTAPETRAQLKLAQGVGLSVVDIVSGSPAEEAGLQRHDILYKLGDQLLINQQQFGTLVRMHGVGQTIGFSLYRAGDRVDVELTIGKTRRTPRAVQAQVRFGPGGVQVVPLAQESRMMLNAAQDIEARRRQIEARLEEIRQRVIGNPHLDSAERDRLRQMIDDARQVGDRVDLDIHPHANMTHFMRIADKQHLIQISVVNGQKHLKVSNREKHIIFDGPIDTPEQRESVPTEVMQKVEKLERRANVEIRVESVMPVEPAQEEITEYQLD